MDQAAGNASSAKSLTILDVEKDDTRSGTEDNVTQSLNGQKKAKNTVEDDDDKFVFDVYVPENHYSNNESTSSDNLLNFDDIRLVNFNLEDLFYMMILTFT